MNTKFLIFVLLFITLSTLSAQVNVDPNNKIYSDIYNWENRGVLNNLPSFKPYPLHYLINIMNEVIEKGNLRDIELAKQYLIECDNLVSFTVESKTYLGSIDSGELGSTLLTARGMVTDNISVGIRGGSYFTLDEKNISTLPQYERRNADYNRDTSNVGPLQLMSTWHSVAAFGNDSIWFQTGLGKSSFGTLPYDNVINSPEAPQTAYYALTVNVGDVIFTKDFHQVVATDLKGEGQYPEKFITSNGVTWQVYNWLNLGIFDSVTYGGRFDAIYLLPFTQLMYSQGVNGFLDNAMIGVTGEIEFPKNINLKGAALIDDFAFNDAMKLNFDSKYKFGLQTVLNWAPEKSIIKQIEIGYTMLTPHMYTHEPAGYRIENDTLIYDYTDDGEENINYSNYTNRGESFGSSLLPNSDSISAKSDFNMPFGLNLNIFAKFTRNANSSDSLPEDFHDIAIIMNDDGSYFLDVNGDGSQGEYYIQDDEILTAEPSDGTNDYTVAEEPVFLGDGSLDDHGVLIMTRYGVMDHWRYAWTESFPFMDQPNINYTFQTGLNLSKNWHYDFSDITAKLDYTFQSHNSILNHFITLNLTFEF